MPTYRYRIGSEVFGERDEAEAWAAAGNIGGCYSIVRQVFCDYHDWQDELFEPILNKDMCERCADFERRTPQYKERQRLAAWNAGAAIKGRE